MIKKMSLIQEALKRQEEDQKKANDDQSISEAISDDVELTLKPKEPISHSDIIEVSTPEDSPIVDSILDDNDGLDDFILPDGFSMDSLDNVQDTPDTPDTPALLIKDDVEETPSLLAKKEELEFNPTVESKKESLAPPESLGSLKLQNKAAPKKLYENPVEKEPAKKLKKKKKVVEAEPPPSGTAVHPALNNTDDSTEESSDKKSTFKVILVVILFLILIGAGIYYGLSLMGVDIDMSSITKYIPGKEILNKTSTVSSSDDLNKGTIKVSKVVDNPKSTAGKAIHKANVAAQDLQQAQKQEGSVTESLPSSEAKTVEKSDVKDTPTVNPETTTSVDPVGKKAAEKSLSDKYQNSRMTERIKAKLEAKRLEEERLQKVQQKTDPIEKNVVWPSVALSGTIGLSKSGAAIFDKSNIVNVGETYKGMKLIDVTKDKKSGVILEYEGQTRFLATGQSI